MRLNCVKKTFIDNLVSSIVFNLGFLTIRSLFSFTLFLYLFTFAF